MGNSRQARLTAASTLEPQTSKASDCEAAAPTPACTDFCIIGWDFVLQALERIARPYPALFCVCVAFEACRAAVQATKGVFRYSTVCRSAEAGDAPSQGGVTTQMDTIAAAAVDAGSAEHLLDGKACLFKAAARAQQQSFASCTGQRAGHRSFDRITQASVLARSSPHAHNQHASTQLSCTNPTTAVSHGTPGAQQQALLAAVSHAAPPFALFAAQPSSDVWLKLLHALTQGQGDEDVAVEKPHSILLPRRASSGSLGRQQAVMHRATIQQAPPAGA